MPSDLDRLQGTWYVTSIETDGTRLPASAIGESQIVVTGTRFTSLAMGATYAGTLELQQGSRPKGLDLLFTAGPEQGNRNRGIYKLEGARWTICLATRGTNRPTTFTSKSGTGVALQTLSRAKARRRPVSSASRTRKEPPTDIPQARETTVLEGEWEMVAGTFNGAAMDAGMVKWCRRVTRGDITTVLAGPQVMLKAKFTLGPPNRSHEIDYLNLIGTAKDKVQAGIFELTDDTVQICMAAPGKPRPAEFTSGRGDGRSFTVWRRK
jgi:uncharacterized protein (TIGR03067 family)